MRSHRPIPRASVVLGLATLLLLDPGAATAARAEPVPSLNPVLAAGAPRRVDASTLRAEEAVEALSLHVRKKSHPEALRVAFRAYYRYRAANPRQVTKPYLYFVDYGLDSRTARGYVFDMDALRVLDGPFMVAHGRGSAAGGSGIPTRFSNRHGSYATSLGLYLTQETYAFRGTSGGRRYSSIGLRLRGVSGSFNSAARARGVVVHGAPYVTAERAGRSEGCPAMEPARAQRLLPLLRQGSMVFHFSPRDAEWMRLDPWALAPLPRADANG